MQRLARQVTVDERRARSNPFKSKPQEQVAATVAPIKGNDFALLDPQIVHKPVADSLDFEIKLLVSPLRSFELHKEMIGSIFFGPILQAVVDQQLVLGLLLGNKSH